MKNKTLLFIAIVINVVMIFLLIHKQHKTIHLLYDLQQLQEEKNALMQEKKDLMLELQKIQQLSSIQTYAQQTLNMKSIPLKEAKTISISSHLQKEQHGNN